MNASLKHVFLVETLRGYDKDMTVGQVISVLSDELALAAVPIHQELVSDVKDALKAEKKTAKKAIKDALKAEKKTAKKAIKDALKAEKKTAKKAIKDALKAEKKTAKDALKDALKAEKKAAKDALKDALKAEKKAAKDALKDALKAEKKAAKDALKAEKKAAKDALKAEKKAVKDTLKAKAKIRYVLSKIARLKQAYNVDVGVPRRGWGHADGPDELEVAFSMVEEIEERAGLVPCGVRGN